jgi:predicted dehydrogenase
MSNREYPQGPIRVGLIGLGYWGPHYARIFAELEDAELVWCCDANPESLDLARNRFPWVKPSSDVADLLKDESVAAVAIATPTTSHADLACAALNAGKHVLIEKPLATSVDECRRIEAAADGLVAMVGHTFLYNPAIEHLRASITRGELGDVHYMTAVRTGLGPIREDVNVLWDLGPHDVSIFLDLIDAEPVSVAATGQGYLRDGREDVVYMAVRFDNGVLAHAHLSWLEPYKVRQVTLVGQEKMAVFDDVAGDERLKVLDRGAHYDTASDQARGSSYGEYKAILRQGTVTAPFISPQEPLRRQCEDFIRAISTDSPPYSGIRTGRRVVSLLEAADRSLREGGAPVTPQLV